jgi:hypothetical protein
MSRDLTMSPWVETGTRHVTFVGLLRRVCPIGPRVVRWYTRQPPGWLVTIPAHTKSL